MAEPTSIQHVYGRRTDDPENLRLLNSLRYYNDGRFRVKDWSPEIHRHELAVKKREREDQYIKSLHDAPKPVMFVQKKEVFRHTPLSKSVTPLAHNEAFFKVAGESKPIQSVAHEMLKERANGVEREVRLIRKQKSTPVIAKRLQTPDKLNRIVKSPVVDPKNELEFYKIEGLEFLPESFLELEPVLFHDEYRFGSDRDRAKFSQEQRKLVARRRKQYQLKETKRMRQVTLFVVKDFIQNLDAFFEAWFTDNQRRMTPEETDYLAKELEVKREAVEHMQEEFLRKKKEKNAATLSLYFQGRDFQSMDKLARLPRFLQEYFFNFNKQDYSHVKSKHMDVHKKREEAHQSISKKSSNLTFRMPSKQNLGTTDNTNRFFDAVADEGGRLGGTGSQLKVTMEQIIEGNSQIKVKDFRPEAVEGVEARTMAATQSSLIKLGEAPDTIEGLNQLLEAFQKEKQAHTKFQNRDLPANCETRLDKDFNLMNCKITLQPPAGVQSAASPRKQFENKARGKKGL